jgi:hypothetical protein
MKRTGQPRGRYTLTDDDVRSIERTVVEVLDDVKTNYLPRAIARHSDKRIVFKPGTIKLESDAPMQALVDEAVAYLEQQRLIEPHATVGRVAEFLRVAEARRVKTTPETVLGGQRYDIMGTATRQIDAILDRLPKPKRLSGLEAIKAFNASQGITDPVVFFIAVRDKYLCAECRRLHFLPNRITPRCWFLSELKEGAHKRGDAAPKINGLHDDCRCTIATMMHGWGFDDEGKITFVAFEHDELKSQRSSKRQTGGSR